jgi:hypothetical protein
VASRYRDEAELRTPLHWAAMMGDTRLVNFLLDKGADTCRLATGVSAYGCADVTPLIAGFQVMYACHDDGRKYDTAAFYRLLDSATPEMINVRLREDNGCSGSNDAASPLAAACDMLELNLVNALLAKGADPNFPATSKGDLPGEQSPLTEAVASYAKRQKENAKKIEIAKALLAAGADVNLYKNLLSLVEGNAPLRELLIEHGALSMRPVTWWSDDKSRAEIKCDYNRMIPSTEDLTDILQQQSLLELHLHDGSASMNPSLFQEVPGTNESVKKLSCCFCCGNGDIGDMEESALPLLSKFPRLEELTWDYAHEWINEHQMLKLARVTPNLSVLRLHGDSDGPEGSRRIYVSDSGVARLSAALPLQSLWVGSSSFLTRASEPVDYADGDYGGVWEPVAFDLSPKALEAMARHCPSLESVCLNSYGVDCFYDERERGSFDENQMPAKTAMMELAPLRCLRHLALRLLLTDDNVACIAKSAPNLSKLELVSPLLTDAALAAVATCSKLEALSFDARCSVSDAGVLQLAGGCPRLQKVVIQRSRKLTAASIIALAKLPVLRILYLTGAKEGFATAAACDSLRAGCVQLECLYLEGFRRMGADAMEALSQCTALRVLNLSGELSREDLPRICAAFSSGFGALRMWKYSAPHRFAKSLIRRSCLQLHSWEDVDRDMTPEQDARARVRLQRPDIKVTGILGVSDETLYRRRSTAIDAAREAYLNAFALRKGLFDVARGYASDDYDEDEGRGEEVSHVSLTDLEGSVAPAEEHKQAGVGERGGDKGGGGEGVARGAGGAGSLTVPPEGGRGRFAKGQGDKHPRPEPVPAPPALAVEDAIARLQVHPTLPAGTRVELHGLQSAVHLNGRVAHVLGLNTDSGRVTVELILAQEGEAHLQKVKETNIRGLDPLPRTADALAEILGAARAACRVSIPAGKYVAAALSHLEIPTALTIEGHKAELHFAVSVAAEAKGARLRLANFSVVNAPLIVRGKDVKQVVLENITVSLPPHTNNDALTLSHISQLNPYIHGHAGSILIDRCTVRGGSECVFIDTPYVHLRGCHISGAANRGIFANADFVIEDSVVTGCGGYGMKTRAGCERRGKNNIQTGPWDSHMQRGGGWDGGFGGMGAELLHEVGSHRLPC